jgi:hypothetical protein
MAWVSEFPDLITLDPRFGYRSLSSSSSCRSRCLEVQSPGLWRSVNQNEELECSGLKRRTLLGESWILHHEVWF